MKLRIAVLALLGLFVLGAALCAYGGQLPAYTDVAAMERLRLAPEVTDTGCVVGDRWHENVNALRTARNPLLNGGGALMLTAATVLLLLGAAASRGATTLGEIGTPRSLATFFGAGILSTVWFLFALAYSFVIDFHRGAFPWCADSIAIPIFGLEIAGAFLLPVLVMAGLVVSRFFGSLPERLGIWDADRPVRSWIWTILTGLAVSGLALIIAASFLSAEFLVIPSCLVGLYLVLSTRAAVLAPRRP